MSKVETVLSFVLAVNLVGCGGGGAGSFSSGVDEGKSLGSLSKDEVTKLCTAADSWAKDNVKIDPADSCKLSGLLGIITIAAKGASATDKDVQDACKAAYDQCLKAPSQTTTSMTSSAMCQAPPASCTATVGEYDACLESIPGYVKTIFDGIPSCDKLTKASLMDPNFAGGGKTPEEPAACKTLESKCPTFKWTGSSAMPTKMP